MKKLVSFSLVLVMILSLSMTAFAATVTKGDQNIDVKAKYEGNITTSEIYSVDVTWGAMQFTYSESGAMTWNPADHTYTDNVTSGWTADGNTITVTNHSNAEVNAEFSFEALDAYKTVSGEFTVAAKALGAGVVDGYDSADKVETVLKLKGALPETVTEYTKIGSIKVKIS